MLLGEWRDGSLDFTAGGFLALKKHERRHR